MLCPVELRAPRKAQCSRELNRIQPAAVVRSPAAFQAVVAQLVEQLIRNQQVTGSSQVNGSTLSELYNLNRGDFSIGRHAGKHERQDQPPSHTPQDERTRI